MADGQWKSLSFDLGPIKPLAEGVQRLTDTLTLVLTIVQTATDIVAKLIVDILSAEALLIQTALQAIEDVLTQYIEGAAKIHLLTVPPRVALPPDAQELLSLSPYNDGLTTNLRPNDVSDMSFQDKLNAVFNVEGGNASYGRTVMESIADERDLNRPQYSDTDAYYAVVILAGGTSILELFDYVIRLMAVFDGALKSRKMLPAVVARTPQDLRARTIAAPGTPRVGVHLNWTNPPTDQVLTGFGENTRVSIQEIAILRSTDPRTIAAKGWDGFMLGYQPTPLGGEDRERSNVKTFTTGKGQTTLLKLKLFDGAQDSYVDNDATLAKGQDYYYALAYRYGLAVADRSGKYTTFVSQRYQQISNTVKVRVDADKIPFSYGGTPPDWDATPSALDLFPDLKYFLALLRDYVETLKSQVVGASNALQSYLAFLKSEVDRYIAYATMINERVKSLIELMRLPQSGIYVTLISGSRGGTQAFASALTQRLSDESDITAPPYFRHGVTAGVVLFAGAPNPANLASVQALISLLLGLSSGPTAFEQAVDSIDQVLTVVEQKTFTEAMLPGPAPEVTEAQQTFDDTMAPVAATDDSANVPFDP